LPQDGSPPTTRFLTYYSWVSEWPWYEYAQYHPECVPSLLIDRALCEEPFLDVFAASPAERQPVISGVCRCRKPKVGDRFVYTWIMHRFSVPSAGPARLMQSGAE